MSRIAALPMIPLILLSAASGQAPPGMLSIVVRDAETNELIPCRIHLTDAGGKAQRADSLPFWNDHFVCPGEVRLEIPSGEYRIEIERGPEYGAINERVRVDGATTVTYTLRRLVNLAADGWWSGELHVHRPLKDVELLMRAEDLHVAPIITWWNKQNPWTREPIPANPLICFDGNRYYHVLGGEDEREGGALLFFNLSRPLAITEATREHPSPMKFVEEARRFPGGWIDVEKPFWWDVPIWLASGKIDSIGIANNHQCRSQMYESEAWGKPRVVERLPPPLGNGFWSQEIYYHLLNCGLRVPPSAGSASGVLPNPVGYNRVYVKVDGAFTHDKWWEGLRQGRSFVTNGPLLRVTANGELPGHVFAAAEGEELRLALTAQLSTRDRVPFFEIVKDGHVVRKVPFEEWSKSGSLGTIAFQQSGWFLVRAITDNPKTFRFASTAPFYVEVGAASRRISKSSAQFFLDWTRDRARRVRLDDPAQREEVLEYHRMAERFWEERVAKGE